MPWFFKTNIIQHARGSEEAKLLGQKSIEEAKLTADDVAQIVLKQAGKGKFHIIITREAKTMWWLKRLSPVGFFSTIRKLNASKQKELEEILEKQAKNKKEAIKI